MHVGWAALFSPPTEGPRPTFDAIRAHIEGRLGRAPRYRQKLAEVPLGLDDPVWVDDPHFDIALHVRRARGVDFRQLVDEVMSTPLDHHRALWELWIAEQLDDGQLGVIGKAHHCLVDGLAAVEETLVWSERTQHRSRRCARCSTRSSRPSASRKPI